jgi:hypothetical protein
LERTWKNPFSNSNDLLAMNSKESMLGIVALALVIMPVLIPATQTFGQEEEEQQQDDEITPAPPSIGADIPLTYFGPAPSTTQKELVGPLQLLRSGTIDMNESTITLPLYQGHI